MELLVVVAIIALLVAITIPVVGHMKTRAKAAAQRQQLAGLSQALATYYADNGNVYPPSDILDASGNPTQAYGVIGVGRGGAMLAQGLMGYLPYALDGGNTASDNLGFRTHGSGTNAVGALHGPYGSSDSKYFIDNNPGTDTDRSFVDVYGNEILYFRSTRAVADRSGMKAVTQVFGTDVTSVNGNNFYFYTNDNATLPPGSTAAARTSPDASPAFLALLGASSNNITTGSANILGADSFLLISPGPDGIPFTSDDVVIDNKQ